MSWKVFFPIKKKNRTLKSAIDSAKKNNTLRAGKLDPVVKEQLENVVVSHTNTFFDCIKTKT